MATDHLKYIFVLQLPEDKTKNYIGMLTDNYQYSSFDMFVKSKYLTSSVMKLINKKLRNLNIDDKTQIILSNTITKEHPLYIFLSIIRKFIKFKFTTVATEKTFKRITTYHTSYSIGRQFQLQDYNKLYKKLLANEDCNWITKETDYTLQNIPRAAYRIQKILRICMYYMCIKQYYLSRAH